MGLFQGVKFPSGRSFFSFFLGITILGALLIVLGLFVALFGIYLARLLSLIRLIPQAHWASITPEGFGKNEGGIEDSISMYNRSLRDQEYVDRNLAWNEGLGCFRTGMLIFLLVYILFILVAIFSPGFIDTLPSFDLLDKLGSTLIVVSTGTLEPFRIAIGDFLVGDFTQKLSVISLLVPVYFFAAGYAYWTNYIEYWLNELLRAP
jgi:hypothetical protein